MPINPNLVHVYRLTDAIEGRTDGAWIFQYHGESFVTDPGGGNPEPFAWADQPHEILDFEVKTRQEIAGALRINPAKLGIVQRTEADFPEPILTFRDGPIWSAEAVAPWAPRQTPVPARERGLPRG